MDTYLLESNSNSLVPLLLIGIVLLDTIIVLLESFALFLKDVNLLPQFLNLTIRCLDFCVLLFRFVFEMT